MFVVSVLILGFVVRTSTEIDGELIVLFPQKFFAACPMFALYFRQL